MIKRYSRKELTDIWSEENKYKIWLDVEVAAAEAMEKLGQIPKGVASVVRKKAKINVFFIAAGRGLGQPYFMLGGFQGTGWLRVYGINPYQHPPTNKYTLHENKQMHN